MDRQNYIIGILLLLSVVLLWTLSSFLVQNLFVFGYNKPFLVTYLKCSTVSLYLLPELLRRYMRRPGQYEYTQVHPPSPTKEHRRSLDEAAGPAIPAAQPQGPMTTRETAELAGIFCVLWFFANWTTNASLGYTSVASSTILASTSGFFTLAVGRVFRVETLTLGKLAAVATSFAGVVIVSLSDHSYSGTSNFPHAAFGDFLSLVSALLYAFYVIVLKVRTGDESRLNTQLFFGFVGLFITLGMWPVAVVLHLTGIEPFGLPSGSSAWAALFISMGITWSSNYLYVLAMLKTTPLVVTIGLSLTIPMAVLGDFWLGRMITFPTVTGAALVLVAFGMVGRESAAEKPAHVSVKHTVDPEVQDPLELQDRST